MKVYGVLYGIQRYSCRYTFEGIETLSKKERFSIKETRFVAKVASSQVVSHKCKLTMGLPADIIFATLTIAVVVLTADPPRE